MATKRVVQPGGIRKAQMHARHLLAALKIVRPPVDVKAVAQYLGVRIVEEEFPEKDRVSGAIVRRADGTLIIVNPRQGKARKRFTIAHEIGHHVLHDFDVHVDQARFRDETTSAGTDPEEVEANAFAAELVMPEALIRARLRGETLFGVDEGSEDLVAEIAKEFEVSAQAMAWRLTNLRILV